MLLQRNESISESSPCIFLFQNLPGQHKKKKGKEEKTVFKTCVTQIYNLLILILFKFFPQEHRQAKDNY